MRHHVTAETRDLLEALDHIRRRVQPKLDRVSTEARAEWVSLLLKFPADEEVGLGVIETSPDALSEMIAKASRFEQIVKTLKPRRAEASSSEADRDGQSVGPLSTSG